MERTVKLSGSLGLAVIVGTKAVEWMDFPEDFKRTIGPHFVAKTPNFSFLAPKLMRFFQKTGI